MESGGPNAVGRRRRRRSPASFSFRLPHQPTRPRRSRPHHSEKVTAEFEKIVRTQTLQLREAQASLDAEKTVRRDAKDALRAKRQHYEDREAKLHQRNLQLFEKGARLEEE
jgi:hypothetical protein